MKIRIVSPHDLAVNGKGRSHPLNGRDLRVLLVTNDGEEILLPVTSLTIACGGRKAPIEATVTIPVDEIDVTATLKAYDAEERLG